MEPVPRIGLARCSAWLTTSKMDVRPSRSSRFVVHNEFEQHVVEVAHELAGVAPSPQLRIDHAEVVEVESVRAGDEHEAGSDAAGQDLDFDGRDSCRPDVPAKTIWGDYASGGEASAS